MVEVEEHDGGRTVSPVEELMAKSLDFSVEELQARLQAADGELATRQAELTEAYEEEHGLKARLPVLMAMAKASAESRRGLQIECFDETIALGPDSDVPSLAEKLGRHLSTANYISECLQHLGEVRLPRQRLQVLTCERDSAWAAAEVAHNEALIASKQLRIALEPTLELEGEVSVTGARTEALAVRAVMLYAAHARAVEALTAEIQRQQRNLELKASTGILTTRNLS
jgi:hypothetical protein